MEILLSVGCLTSFDFVPQTTFFSSSHRDANTLSVLPKEISLSFSKFGICLVFRSVTNDSLSNVVLTCRVLTCLNKDIVHQSDRF